MSTITQLIEAGTYPSEADICRFAGDNEHHRAEFLNWLESKQRSANKRDTNNVGRTAIARTKPSAPTRKLQSAGLIRGYTIDYGCGRGADVRYLSSCGHTVKGYDVHHQPKTPRGGAETIVCNFVLNVISDNAERDAVVRDIQSLLSDNGIAYVSVRNDKQSLRGATRIGTWQGYIDIDGIGVELIQSCATYRMYRITKQARDITTSAKLCD